MAARGKLTALFGLSLCVLLSVSRPCKAGSLLGATLGWQYYAYGGIYTYPGGTTSGSFVDNGGVGGTFIGGTSDLYFEIIADANSITFDYSVDTLGSDTWSPSALSLAPTIYNGIAINLLSSGSFSSVTIDPATNMVGFNTSDLSFTANQIQVNWASLPFDPNTIVKLDVNSTSTVPEPGTIFLIPSGLVALGFCRRKLKMRGV